MPKHGFVSLPPKQRDLDRVPLWLGQPGKHGFGYAVQQIPQSAEGQLGFRLCRPARQRPVALPGDARQRLTPERGLADACRAVDHAADRAVIRCLEDGGQFDQLPVAADKAVQCWAPVLPLTQPAHCVSLARSRRDGSYCARIAVRWRYRAMVNIAVRPSIPANRACNV